MNGTKSLLLKENKLFFNINLTTRCNLKCRRCQAFINFAESWTYPLDDFRKDIEHLKNIGAEVGLFCIVGGEPFMVPNLIEYLEILRNNFPDTKIITLTNGIKLLTFNHFEDLKRLNIEISVTVYPIPLKEKILEKMEYLKLNGLIIYKQSDGIDEKGNLKKIESRDFMSSIKFKFSYNIENTFNNCDCDFLQLSRSEIFSCQTASNCYIIKDFIDVNPNTGISVYDFKSNSEIINFSKQPNSNCKYCFRPFEQIMFKWENSKGKIEDFK